MGGAGQTLRIGQLLQLPREQRQILAAEVPVYAECHECFRGRDEPCFLAQFPCRSVGEIFARLRGTLRDVPAGRARRVTEQDALAVGDDYATARLPPSHGRAPPAEMPP